MRNSLKEWCEAADISVAEIDRRACEEVENGKFPTLVFISVDLNSALARDMASTMRHSPASQAAMGSSILGINTSVGQLNFKPVMRLRNFLMVGRQEDFDAMAKEGFDQQFWNDQERARIDKAFEDIVIMEGDE